MKRYRFFNGCRVSVNSFYDSYTEVSSSVVVPSRSYTIQDLARRLQDGLPMPQMVSYRIYDDVGLNHQIEPTDLLSAYQLSSQIEENNIRKQQLIKDSELKNDVSNSEIPNKPTDKKE